MARIDFILPGLRALLPWLLHSVRGRFLAISTLIISLLFASAIYTWNLVSTTAAQTTGVINDYYELEYLALQKLTVDIRDLETSIYQYAVLLDAPLDEEIKHRLDKLLVDVQHLEQWSREKGLLEVSGTIAALEGKLHSLRATVVQLLSLLETPQQRFPAIDTIYNQMYPSRQVVNAAITHAIHEVEQDESSAITRESFMLWQRLEHAWMQYTFESRMVIANRSGVFGDPESMKINHEHHLLWKKRIESLLQQLGRRDQAKQLGLQQSESLAEIQQNFERYDSGYNHVYTLMTSDKWRLDLPYLREHIRPAFDSVRASSLLLREQFTKKMKGALANSQEVSSRLLHFIVLLVAVAMLLMLVSYYVFIRFVYRPLKEVAMAMEAAGRGEHYSLLRDSHIGEIDMLVHAYDGMQAQVQSRQVRLQSILENISDGIITIDENGIIETFNEAAQQLFGYSFEEAFGQSVTLLMPDAMKDSHSGYMDNYKRQGIRHAIDREREEVAQRKDGSHFPMSIKVKEMVIDDKRYFIAVVSDISERKAAMERLREMADKDALTGLHNRRYFLDELERSVNRAVRGGVSVTLLYLDLDNFKFVNDTMGHQAGDQVLIELTEMLGSRVRSGDLFARLGGDEFAILLYQVDDDTAVSVAC
jgi:PAS domain S-box-containing protein